MDRRQQEVQGPLIGGELGGYAFAARLDRLK